MTPDPLRLELGGLGFLVWCASAPVLADLEPPYLPFVVPAGAVDPGERARRPSGGRRGDIEVEVRLGAPPAFPGAAPLFETDRAWTMRAEGDRRLVLQRSPHRDAPLWTTSFVLGVERATIWSDAEGGAPRADGLGVSCPLRYPLDQILLMYALARAGGLLVHATGVVVDGRALVCCGVSGAGKSTLARQFLAVGAGDLLSDDRVVVRPVGGRAQGGGPRGGDLRAFGTPWPGDARIAVNGSAPLGALLFLRHGAENRVVEITPADALHRLLPVASIPWFDADAVSASLGICEQIVGVVPAYELEFRPEPAAAEAVLASVASGAMR